MDKNLAIITVNFENYSVTKEFLTYFKDVTDTAMQIFIIDLSRKKEALPTNNKVTVIPAENKGYAYGINIGLTEAIGGGFDKFVIINNDTRIDAQFISCVYHSLNNHSSSIISGKIYYEVGFEYHKNRYQKEEAGKVIWYAGGNIDWQNVYIKHRGVDKVDNGKYDQFEETDFVSGCLMCFDKQVIDRIGLWDESYFLYYEDADYCERAKRKGIKLFYDPSIVIWHKNAQSTQGSGSKLHQKYQNINRLKFGIKYAPLKTKLHLLKDYIFAPVKQ